MKIEPIYTSKANSILLKQKGFDVECPKVYDHTNSVVDAYYGSANNNRQESEYRGFMTAPEHWVLIEWLKQVHGIWVSIGRDEYNKYFYEIDLHSITYGYDETYDTPYEATEAAINYVLTNLI